MYSVSYVSTYLLARAITRKRTPQKMGWDGMGSERVMMGWAKSTAQGDQQMVSLLRFLLLLHLLLSSFCSSNSSNPSNPRPCTSQVKSGKLGRVGLLACALVVVVSTVQQSTARYRGFRRLDCSYSPLVDSTRLRLDKRKPKKNVVLRWPPASLTPPSVNTRNRACCWSPVFFVFGYLNAPYSN